MSAQSGGNRRRLHILIFFVSLTLSRPYGVKGDDGQAAPKVAECTQDISQISVTVDETDLKAEFRCLTEQIHLWPSEDDGLGRYCQDDTCENPADLPAGMSLNKGDNEPPLTYTLTVTDLPAKEKKLYFQCEKTAYSSRTLRNKTSAKPCLVTVIVPAKPSPNLNTCEPKTGTLELAIPTAGGTAAFKCGAENNELSPSTMEVFGADCTRKEKLETFIPSATMSAVSSTYSLKVLELPKTDTTVCYKCVGKTGGVDNECSIKIRISSANTTSASCSKTSMSSIFTALVFALCASFFLR